MLMITDLFRELSPSRKLGVIEKAMTEYGKAYSQQKNLHIVLISKSTLQEEGNKPKSGCLFHDDRVDLK